MNADLNNLHSYGLMACVGPCGTEAWCHATTKLCLECRKGTNMSSTSITLAPSQELAAPAPAELAPTSQVLAEYLSPESRAFVLETDEDLALASGVINDIAARLAVLEEVRQSVSLPISRGLDNYNALFRPAKERAKEARQVWDAKVRAFLDARAAATRAAEAALQQAIATQNAPAATAAIQAIQPAARASGLTFQQGWDYTEFNHDIVPTSMTVLDRAAVLAEIKRQIAEGVVDPAIPGLKIFKKQVVKATG